MTWVNLAGTWLIFHVLFPRAAFWYSTFHHLIKTQTKALVKQCAWTPVLSWTALQGSFVRQTPANMSLSLSRLVKWRSSGRQGHGLMNGPWEQLLMILWPKDLCESRWCRFVFRSESWHLTHGTQYNTQYFFSSRSSCGPKLIFFFFFLGATENLDTITL